MDRKTFIKKTASAVLIAAPAISLINCSSSEDSSSNNNNSGNPDCSNNGARASSISANHGHSLTVSREDVNAGVEKTYSIEGSASHSHSVTVTAANFITLQNNQQIVLTSSVGNSHEHTVTVSCA